MGILFLHYAVYHLSKSSLGVNPWRLGEVRWLNVFVRSHKAILCDRYLHSCTYLIYRCNISVYFFSKRFENRIRTFTTTVIIFGYLNFIMRRICTTKQQKTTLEPACVLLYVVQGVAERSGNLPNTYPKTLCSTGVRK